MCAMNRENMVNKQQQQQQFDFFFLRDASCKQIAINAQNCKISTRQNVDAKKSENPKINQSAWFRIRIFNYDFRWWCRMICVSNSISLADTAVI